MPKKKPGHPPPQSVDRGRPPSEPVDNRYVAIRDTRERSGHGWSFPESVACGGTVRRKLDTGDYSLEGYEHVFTVDRKGSVGEFAQNLFQPRFHRELERMSSMKLAVVLLEFDFEALNAWPKNSGVPLAKRRFMKVTKSVLLAQFWKIKMKYPHVEFLFAGDMGEWAVSSLFKRVIEMYGPGKV